MRFAMTVIVRMIVKKGILMSTDAMVDGDKGDTRTRTAILSGKTGNTAARTAKTMNA
jgi:hypothetical protein